MIFIKCSTLFNKAIAIKGTESGDILKLYE
jgi:hypothetical protein